MTANVTNRHSLPKTLRAAGFIASVIAGFTAFSAQAGECPADQLRPDGSGQQAGATMPKDVTDTVLATTDLSQEMVGVEDHQFRIRRLELMPGGEVPWHSHEDRPAMIYIVSGEVTEYASTCAVPILHKAGDVAPETHTTAHWWKNTGKEKAVLISADILHDKMDSNM